jgi:outer membrane protein assembly factor BamB
MNAAAQGQPTVVGLRSTSVGGASTVALVGSQDGRVYAVNAATGAQLWASPVLGPAVQAAPAAMFKDFGGAYDLILVGTRDSTSNSKFYGLNLSDGSIAWTFDNGPGPGTGIGIISAQAAVDYAANRVYFASRRRAGGSSGTAWCLSFTNSTASLCTGTWPVDVGEVDGGPSVRGNVLYLGNNSGEVRALDASSGAALWTYSPVPNDGPVKSFVWTDFLSNRLYFSTTGKVHAIQDNGASASAYWTGGAASGDAVPIPSASAPLLQGGRVYVGGANSLVYSIDAASSAPAAPTSVAVGGPAPKVVGSPTYDWINQVIIVGTDQGTFFAVQLPF